MPVADFPGRRNWGYDGVLPFAPAAAYGTPGRPEALVDAAHASGSDGAARRRLQPFRSGRQLPAHLRAGVLQSASPDALGRGDQFRRRRQPPCARLLHPQRALLDRGVPLRRAAARRRARDRRRLGAGHRDRAGADGRDCGPSATATSTSCSRTTATRRATWCAMRPGARLWRPRNGTTTSIMRCTCSSPARATATTPTTRSVRCGNSAAAWPKGLPTRASRRHFAAVRRAANRARSCPRPRSSPSLRRTTRSATARSANGSSRWPTRRRCAPRWPACCWRRRRRCCSWARSSARRRLSCSSATSGPSWLRRYRAAAARNSGASNAFATRRCRRRSPTRTPRRPSPPAGSTGERRIRRPARSGWPSIDRCLALRRRASGAAPSRHERTLRRRSRRICCACAGRLAGAELHAGINLAAAPLADVTALPGTPFYESHPGVGADGTWPAFAVAFTLGEPHMALTFGARA